MRIFMLGWEFPPFISGGLGTACYGLTKAMDQLGMKVTFVLPKVVESQYTTHVKLLSPASHMSQTSYYQTDEMKNVKFRALNSLLQPYFTPQTYQSQIEEILKNKRLMLGSQSLQPNQSSDSDYGTDMYTEIHRYAAMASELALGEDFDIIHAHDWMTYSTAAANMSTR